MIRRCCVLALAATLSVLSFASAAFATTFHVPLGRDCGPSVLADLYSTSFLKSAAADHCRVFAIDQGILVPVPTPRPTQGSNVLTATDISMTSASDGALAYSGGSANAIAGSVGLNY